jgi:hypothetical protein
MRNLLTQAIWLGLLILGCLTASGCMSAPTQSGGQESASNAFGGNTLAFGGGTC